MKTLSENLEDWMVKALEWDIADSLEFWHKNTIYSKLKQCTNKICELALRDKTNTILSTIDKQALRTYLDNQGIVLTTIDDLPNNIKREIVIRANIKSAAERLAEMEEMKNM